MTTTQWIITLFLLSAIGTLLVQALQTNTQPTPAEVQSYHYPKNTITQM